MRLPRRVPWASLAELDQVCAWIYTDENDIDTRTLAIQRLSAWRAMTTLPHALESALAILTTMVRDSESSVSSLHLHIRQSYASAIIRMVNGFVDPLQLGAYARSIASIAAQLNMPAWLVELRHAATHEELPSLEVLREAARDAMGWLLHNYFLPSINPSIPASSTAPSLRPVWPLLRQYKSLLKITTRDASLRSQYKPEVTKTLRDIERWLAEAKVAADVSATALEWDAEGNEADSEGENREQWALGKFCEALLEKGGLVPMSKKKRAITSSFMPAPGVLQIWTPLITHMRNLHASLPSILVAKILTSLTANEMTEETQETISLDSGKSSQDPSYDICIASWANWLVQTFAVSPDDDDDGVTLTREDIVVQLVTNLAPTRQQTAADHRAARTLLDTLCSDHPYLQEIPSLLAIPSHVPISWSAGDIDSMNNRLNALLSLHMIDTPGEATAVESQVLPMEAGPEVPHGWRMLSGLEDWKPAPIGMHLGP